MCDNRREAPSTWKHVYIDCEISMRSCALSRYRPSSSQPQQPDLLRSIAGVRLGLQKLPRQDVESMNLLEDLVQRSAAAGPFQGFSEGISGSRNREFQSFIVCACVSFW